MLTRCQVVFEFTHRASEVGHAEEAEEQPPVEEGEQWIQRSRTIKKEQQDAGLLSARQVFEKKDDSVAPEMQGEDLSEYHSDPEEARANN